MNQIPFDPDFDSSQSPALPPQWIFWGGVITGVMVFCTVGFFILLRVYLRG